MEHKLTLSTPIRTGGEDVSELTLRQPTLGMLDGVRLDISAEGGLSIDLGAIRVLVGRMADIPPSAAKTISVKDAFGAKDALKDFFGDVLPIGED